MYIVRWLMGHPIIAIWVLGAIAILLSMDAGNKNHQESGDTTASHTVESTHDVENTAALQVDDNKAVVITKHLTEMQNDEVGAVMLTIAPDTQTTEVKQISDENQLAQGASNQAVSNESIDLTQTSPSELLLMAREAYWNNGLDEAAELYLQLINLEPNVIEHKGELGNVYWRLGNSQKAAELYSEIALPMIKKGNSARVENMVGFIGVYYPEKAAEIHRQIISMQSGN